ncbi:MAG: FAD-dependent oxidoreductase [Syntrophobacteraceae bacterium]|nr:FAD-dependent oxidoreductase [Syntrophobacteraceae bacterium]
MGKHLVLVGAGHAQLTPLTRIAVYLHRGHRVTLINPFSYSYYSGMGPGLLSGVYDPPRVRFNVRKMAERGGAEFIEDSVSAIDAGNRRLLLRGGQILPYDVASFNCGSDVSIDPLWSLNSRMIAVKPVLNLYKARSSILNEAHGRPLRIVVAGGGPGGVEVCANLWRLLHNNGRPAQIVLVAGERLLEGCPPGARRLALKSLGGRGIEVIEGKRVRSVEKTWLTLSDKETLSYDYVFLAMGIRPSVIFRDSGLRVALDGSLPVNRFLQSIDYPELFGGGDCISLEGATLARVGVHAVRQGPILHNNLLAALDGGEMKSYIPKEDYMLILNMGDSKGILFKRGRTCGGRLPFLLKDFIDRRFMRKFQITGELDESI